MTARKPIFDEYWQAAANALRANPEATRTNVFQEFAHRHPVASRAVFDAAWRRVMRKRSPGGSL